MNDTINQTKTCQHCQSSFDITQGDLDFYNKISPTFAGQKFQIPTPTLCPDCRQRRRLAFRNERKLYRRLCDATQQPIIAIYSPDKPYKVYDQKIWQSDSRDPLDYGFEFDFSKTFTENFGELMRVIPYPALHNFNAENSEYCNWANYNKNCYLAFMSSYSEDCMYGTFMQFSQDCVDCLNVVKCQNCYDCIDCQDCHTLTSSSNCRDCSHSSYLQYCQGCSFCYGCNNLDNQQYCIFNKQYSKEEYFDKINLVSKKDVGVFQCSAVPRSTIVNCDNCTGSYLKNCSYCIDCHNGFDGENLKYVLNFGDLKESYDCTAFGHKCALDIENIAGEENYHIGFTFALLNGQDIWYSMFCSQGIKDLFGCIGLRNKQYCIFNKQYENKDKYEEQVAKIIQHMQTTGERGEFFHPSVSPFGYNETVAQEYYPVKISEDGKQMISEDGAVFDVYDSSFIFGTNLQASHGYKRSNYEAPLPQSDKVIQGYDLPVSIQEVDDTILQYAIACEITNKLFRIQAQELVFYRKHNISLPRKHPDIRHLERMRLRR